MQSELEQLLENETKKCPACAEKIKLQAIRCRFCGENFNSDDVNREVKRRLATLQFFVNDSERKRCPKCGIFDAYWAYIEDGSTGYWCPHCKKSVRDILESTLGPEFSLPQQEPTGIVCPHCQKRGHVTTCRVKRKKGISGGKATAALFTLGTSVLFTGLSRKEKVTEARCSNCGSIWYF